MPSEAGNRPTGSAATWFKPGISGNPGGKPVNSRNRLTQQFLHALASDFEKNGNAAIVECREKDPVRYVQIVAGLMPKQVEQSQPLEDVSDAELLAGIALLRSRLAEGAGAGAGQAAGPASVN